ELAGIGPVPVPSAQRLCCDAVIEPIVDGGPRPPAFRGVDAHPSGSVAPDTAPADGPRSAALHGQRLAELFRFLTTKRILPLAAGPARRLIHPALRRQVVARERACRGCDSPASWCDIHHILHWAHGGLTELPNLVLLCQTCHTMVHERGCRLVLHHDGEVTLLADDGRVLRGPPIAA
ncbi:MAG: HNH endonuclease signature motif containing protein, partial [Steroidobacteraceae bacterium]